MARSQTRIAVRSLVEFVRREGGLSALQYHQLSPNAGTRTHQAFFAHLKARYPQHPIHSEYPLELIWEGQDVDLKIGGRADLLILPQAPAGEGTAVGDVAGDDLATGHPLGGSPTPEDFMPEGPVAEPPFSDAPFPGSPLPGNPLYQDQLFSYAEDSSLLLDHPLRDRPFFCEVKTLARPLSEIDPEGDPLHWSQLLIYTALYYFTRPELIDALAADSPLPDLLSKPRDHRLNLSSFSEESLPPIEVPMILCYISQETLACRFLERSLPLAEIWRYFLETLDRYLSWAGVEARHKEQRNRSIEELPFPYATYREGQAQMIEAVEKNLRTGTPLLVQAPTGSGKTMGTVYPALKVLAQGQIDRIFYLTAKSSTRRVAEQALDELRRVGLVARQITLSPKEQMCLAPELYCDTSLCPYAVHYYDHLEEGLTTLLQGSALEAEFIRSVAEEYGLCPFELSLDASNYCDLIIGDYNHALDPRVKLVRFFGESEEREGLLFDEAHNLVDRSREMFSVSLELGSFLSIYRALPDEAWFYRSLLEGPIAHLEQLREVLQDPKADLEGYLRSEQGFNPGEDQILKTDGFLGITAQPEGLLKILRRWITGFREILDSDLPATLRREIVELIGRVRFFLRVCDEFWNEGYITAVRHRKEQIALRLICLDASEFIAELYYPKHAAIFFSATLNPFTYYRQMICGDHLRPQLLDLPSPFDPANLQVLVYDQIDTRYKSRQQSKVRVARAILIAQRAKRGRIIVYFPSYAYMKLILPEVLSKLPKDVEVTVQKPGLNPAQREAWLRSFTEASDNKEVLGFAVLGGLFAEGINLVGDQLTGVIIVGTGLPGLSPERNIMQQYYEERFHNGYDTAYTWPGFNKIQQAAGRVIRTAEDKGFLLLMDDRYRRPDYRRLFPRHWSPLFVGGERELLDALRSGQRGEAPEGSGSGLKPLSGNFASGSWNGLGGSGDGSSQYQSLPDGIGDVQDAPW